MSEFQKVIKYCAIAFAAFLAFTIITGIVTAVFSITGVLSNTSNRNLIDINKSFENVKSLSVDHGIGNLNIESGSGNNVEVNASNVTDDFVVEKSFSGELRVKSKFNFWNFIGGNNGVNDKSKITIYIPEGFTFDRVKLDAGAGNIDIDSVQTEKLDINAGAGNIEGSKIIAEQVKLDGGVGEINFNEVKFTDSDIDSGVGNIKLQGVLYGKNKIECGVGGVTLDLDQSSDDFRLSVDKGLGSIYINGEKYSDLKWNNRTADNVLDVDGGVGDIDINFQ
ncbi:DUF4097 family beta strand repeat-containing protein [Anaerocolumna sp. MB42-C2]|uniref:DUF4097 family beta strand repeat-containing protein n=1 Tax=Anaerocolumna sp. MB42-C2 TaxID=3070997 RepID=UPI0027DECD1E|nr:DUF4097 family beta strand repeat-containing protein [Anaerocolumna sp. MB42-C2]WMJ90037.1 DUF4097 family beta strand repeat-containing protein [Anaerocolumna sp. MB42-C2]